MKLKAILAAALIAVCFSTTASAALDHDTCVAIQKISWTAFDLAARGVPASRVRDRVISSNDSARYRAFVRNLAMPVIHSVYDFYDEHGPAATRYYIGVLYKNCVKGGY